MLMIHLFRLYLVCMCVCVFVFVCVCVLYIIYQLLSFIYFPDCYSGHSWQKLETPSLCTEPILSIHQLDPEVSIIILLNWQYLLSCLLGVIEFFINVIASHDSLSSFSLLAVHILKCLYEQNCIQLNQLKTSSDYPQRQIKAARFGNQN